ncbi:MAG: hypothetical protein V2J07_06200 [Anaerolineae bacterium]|jgi:hypothetical protein|nr:hypothetical protein [Anaerolineae bacterium]
MGTESLTDNLLLTMIFGPLLFGVLCLVVPGRFTPLIFYINFAVHAICLLTLPFVGDLVFEEPVFFFGHPITFTVSTTSNALALLTLTALFLMILINAGQDEAVVTRSQAVIIGAALSAGSVAFFSGQFMIRYIALEIVGLMIALSVLHLWKSGYSSFTDIFVQLRFGDLCLLAAILLLSVRAGTLDIALMIETATRLPLAEQAWILGGFLIAVLFKLAVYPLDGWWVRFAEATFSLKYWIGTVLMPALGLYLLIRVAPLIQAHPVLTYGTAAFAVLLMVMTYGFSRGKRRDFYQRANSLLGGLTLIFAAFMPYLVLREYVIAVLGFRIFSVLQPQLPQRAAQWASYALLVGINVFALFSASLEASFGFMIFWAFLVIVLFIWVFKQPIQQQNGGDPAPEKATIPNQTAAEWLYQHVEMELLSAGVTKSADWFTAGSNWLYQTIESGFDRLWERMGEGLMSLSQTTLRQEDRHQQQARRRIRVWLSRLQQQEEDQQKAPAYWDLIWIPFLLIFILLFLFLR